MIKLFPFFFLTPSTFHTICAVTTSFTEHRIPNNIKFWSLEEFIEQN